MDIDVDHLQIYILSNTVFEKTTYIDVSKCHFFPDGEKTVFFSHGRHETSWFTFHRMKTFPFFLYFALYWKKSAYTRFLPLYCHCFKGRVA